MMSSRHYMRQARRAGDKYMTPERRGIRIAMKESSWQLIVEALEYLVECPDIAGLKGRRAELAGVLQYIKTKMREAGR